MLMPYPASAAGAAWTDSCISSVSTARLLSIYLVDGHIVGVVVIIVHGEAARRGDGDGGEHRGDGAAVRVRGGGGGAALGRQHGGDSAAVTVGGGGGGGL